MTNSILESEKQIKLMNKATDKQIKYIKDMIYKLKDCQQPYPEVDYDNLTKSKASVLIQRLIDQGNDIVCGFYNNDGSDSDVTDANDFLDWYDYQGM